MPEFLHCLSADISDQRRFPVSQGPGGLDTYVEFRIVLHVILQFKSKALVWIAYSAKTNLHAWREQLGDVPVALAGSALIGDPPRVAGAFAESCAGAIAQEVRIL